MKVNKYLKHITGKKVHEKRSKEVHEKRSKEVHKKRSKEVHKKRSTRVDKMSDKCLKVESITKNIFKKCPKSVGVRQGYDFMVKVTVLHRSEP